MKKHPLMKEVFMTEKGPLTPAPVSSPAAKVKKPFKATSIRGRQNDKLPSLASDPIKDASHAEHYATDHGDYCIFKGGGGSSYYAHFVSADGHKTEDLGDAPSRREMIDIVLGHHDKKAAGI